MAKEFEPKIIGFLCNRCSYAGADLGFARIVTDFVNKIKQLGPNIIASQLVK
ncbi:MAG: hypothetical protein JXB88_02800 [Spirochaetales bacterium]|nr:hypothetical protein [Spirochaetales bacterium]